MKPKIKKLWVATLRSGEYKQGRGTLRTNDDKFCCLGVLCNLHAQAHPKIAARQVHHNMYMGDGGYPASAVWQWAGLDSCNPSVPINGENSTLSWLNDNGTTFNQIADLIEAQL